MKVNAALLYIMLVLGSFSLFSCATPASSSLPDGVTESALAPTPAILPTNTPTPMHTPASIGSQEPALYVFDKDFHEDTYIVKGSQTLHYQLGDSLVVYGEITPGTEIAIALLRVVRRNPDSLSAQAVLVHPNLDIRPSLRVDSKLDYLLTSELVPSAQIAIGYLLGEGRVYLRPDRDVKVGDMLEALEPEIASSAILDYLPFDPPVKGRITAVGSNGRVVRVELVAGTWPAEGTILRAVEEVAMTTPAATVTPVAAAGVYRIVITEFYTIDKVQYDPVAHIRDVLRQIVQQRDLVGTIQVERYSEVIPNGIEARDFGQRAQADVVIWGRISGTSLEINSERIRHDEGDGAESVGKLFYPIEDVESSQFHIAITPDFRQFVQYLGAFTLGEYEYIQKNHAEAIALLSEALQLGDRFAVEGNEDIYLALGNAKFSSGDASGAIESYDHALELKPLLIEAHYNRAATNFYYFYKLDEALLDLEEALKRDNRHLNSYILRSIIYGEMGFQFPDDPETQQTYWQNALADVNSAFDLLSEDDRALQVTLYGNRANIYRYMKDYAAAESELLQSLGPAHDCAPLFQSEIAGFDAETLSDSCAQAASGLARVYVQDSVARYDDAIELTELALKYAVHPNITGVTLIVRARAQARLGNNEQACDTLDRALKYLPPDHSIISELIQGICDR